jgi:hypothetical protein
VAELKEIQLLPNTRKKISYSATGRSKLLVLSFVFIGLLAGVYFGLVYYKNSATKNLNNIDQELVANEEARSKTDEDMLLRLKNSLAIIGPLLKNHVLWSDALAHMQSLINPQVQFDSLMVDSAKEEYTFKAFASSYSTVAKQISAFYADDAIKDLSVGKITGQPDGKVDFTIQLSLDSEKLYKNSK